MALMNCFLFILLTILNSVWAENDQMIELKETPTNSMKTLYEDPSGIANYTSFKLLIELELEQFYTQIVGWQAAMYDLTKSKLSGPSYSWPDLQSQTKSSIKSENTSILNTIMRETQSLIELQANKLNQLFTLGHQVRLRYADEEPKIIRWIGRVKANDTSARDQKCTILAELNSIFSGALQDLQKLKSSIRKDFQDQYFKIESYQLAESGRLDQIYSDFESRAFQLISSVKTINISLTSNLTHYDDSLQEGIDSLLSNLLFKVSSSVAPEFLDRISSYLDGKGQQLSGNLTLALSANRIVQINAVDGLVYEIDNGIQSIKNDLDTIKSAYGAKCEGNIQLGNQLSTETMKILQQTSSLITKIYSNLKQMIDSVQL